MRGASDGGGGIGADAVTRRNASAERGVMHLRFRCRSSVQFSLRTEGVCVTLSTLSEMSDTIVVTGWRVGGGQSGAMSSWIKSMRIADLYNRGVSSNSGSRLPENFCINDCPSTEAQLVPIQATTTPDPGYADPDVFTALGLGTTGDPYKDGAIINGRLAGMGLGYLMAGPWGAVPGGALGGVAAGALYDYRHEWPGLGRDLANGGSRGFDNGIDAWANSENGDTHFRRCVSLFTPTAGSFAGWAVGELLCPER